MPRETAGQGPIRPSPPGPARPRHHPAGGVVLHTLHTAGGGAGYLVTTFWLDTAHPAGERPGSSSIAGGGAITAPSAASSVRGSGLLPMGDGVVVGGGRLSPRHRGAHPLGGHHPFVGRGDQIALKSRGAVPMPPICHPTCRPGRGPPPRPTSGRTTGSRWAQARRYRARRSAPFPTALRCNGTGRPGGYAGGARPSCPNHGRRAVLYA
jgi:hypothetical protein